MNGRTAKEHKRWQVPQYRPCDSRIHNSAPTFRAVALHDPPAPCGRIMRKFKTLHCALRLELRSALARDRPADNWTRPPRCSAHADYAARAAGLRPPKPRRLFRNGLPPSGFAPSGLPANGFLAETLATRLLAVRPAVRSRGSPRSLAGSRRCLGPFARIPLRVRLAKMIGSDRQLHADHALDLAQLARSRTGRIA